MIGNTVSRILAVSGIGDIENMISFRDSVDYFDTLWYQSGEDDHAAV